MKIDISYDEAQELLRGLRLLEDKALPMMPDMSSIEKELKSIKP